MANQAIPQSGGSGWLRSRQVGMMAAVFLLVGMTIGYLIPASQQAPSAAEASAQPAGLAPAPVSMGSTRMPTLDELRHMADQQAAPLLMQLKNDPVNITLLTQVGAIYHISHQFKEAAGYYDRALRIDPRNVPIRTRLASSLFRGGDADGAIAQLTQALSYDPTDANALFDLGVIRLQAKGDARGAVAAWQQLLKSNPQLSADRRTAVLKQIAEVRSSMVEAGDSEGAHRHD